MANAPRFSLGLSLRRAVETAAGGRAGCAQGGGTPAGGRRLPSHFMVTTWETWESFAPAFLAKQVSGVKILRGFFFLNKKLQL